MLWSNMYSAASPRFDPLAEVRRLDPVGHVLRVTRAGGVVVATDAADPAGDEVRVARILALHEDRVAAEDRRRAVALDDLAVLEVDLGVDAEAADDAGDRIPRHVDEGPRVALGLLWSGNGGGHRVRPSVRSAPTRCASLLSSVPCPNGATSVPCRRCVR